MRGSRLLVASVLSLSAWLGGCSSITGLSGYSDCPNGCRDATADGSGGPKRDARAGATPDGGLDSTTSSGSGDSGVDDGSTDGAGDDAGDDGSAGATDGGCGAGLTACDGGCVDPTGTANCGGCGNACTTSVGNAQPTCALTPDGGTCGYACSTGYSDCAGACVDYITAANCGGCGNTCSATAPTYEFSGQRAAEGGGCAGVT